MRLTNRIRSSLSLLLALALLLSTLCACVDSDSVSGGTQAATDDATQNGQSSQDSTDASTAPAHDGTTPEHDTNDSDPSELPGSDTDQQTEPVTETETTPESSLPAIDLNGEEFVFLSRYVEGLTSGELTVEGLNTNPVNDAVYDRNQLVEAQLHVTIRNEELTSNDDYVTVKTIENLVSTGYHEYDVIAAPAYTATEYSLKGVFCDLRQSAYLDFDQPWWSQGVNEALEYKDTQFLVTGSIVLSMYRFAFATVFNKQIFSNNGVPYLYENVKDKTWTLDYQNSIIETLANSNGNVEQTLTGYVYGLVTNDNISADPYWSSCQMTILERDEDGIYTLENFDIAKVESVVEKVLKLYYGHGNDVYDFKYKTGDSEQNSIRDMFAGGWAAMATLRIMALESGAMQSMEQEYGVVPMPKYDEAQQEYATLLHDGFTVLAVPTTASAKNTNRLDAVSALLEAMCSISYTTVRPAYYNVTLRTKLVTDPESSEMMDLIFQNVYIDAGILYTIPLSKFHNTFRTLIKENKNTAVSSFKATVKSAEKALKRQILNKLDKLAQNSEKKS